MKHLTAILSITLLVLFLNAISFAGDYYVDAVNGDNSNSGFKADKAFKNISHALSSFTGVPNNQAIIHIAAGTYNMASGESYPLIMSNYMTLQGADRATTILDAEGFDSSVIICDTVNGVIVENVTIKGGKGKVYAINNINQRCGGGIFCRESSPTIRFCDIIDNNSEVGGGICCISNASPIITDCNIKDNNTLWGGGISSFFTSDPTITNCIIENNIAAKIGDIGGCGGGIEIETFSSPSVKNCTIRGNKALWGGGIGIFISSPEITNCIVENNVTERVNGYGGSGGGIDCEMNSSLTVTGCEIRGNRALWGGGIGCFSDSSMTMINCVIESNTVEKIGESGGYGGGIGCEYNSSSNIENCNFKSNQAVYGGGAYFYLGEPKINNCIFEDNKVESSDSMCIGGAIFLDTSPAIIEDSNIIGNIASGSQNYESGGGGIFGYSSSPSINKCKFEENRASRGGGVAFTEGSSGTITNCIISKNKADNMGGGLYFETETTNTKVINCLINENDGNSGGAVMSYKASPKISVSTITGNTVNSGNAFYAYQGGNPTLTSSILWGNGAHSVVSSPKITYSNVEGGFQGEGNIGQDPLFTTGPWGDYYLSQIAAGQDADSPCIDKGSEIPIMGFSLKEYVTRTDGVGDTGIADMGYHFPKHVQFGLSMDPVKTGYTSGDTLTLRLDLVTAPMEITADLYFIMLDPDGSFFSGFSWVKRLQPLVQGFKLPASLNINSAPFINFTLPSTTPPVSKAGTYTFYLGAVKPGTADFISNIASTSFTVQ